MNFKHYAAAMILSSTLAFVSSANVNAATVSSSTVSVTAGDVSVSSSNTKISGDNITFAQVLSSSYNRTVSPSEVLRLRADFNFGFGDISLIYATAEYSGHPIDEISQLRLKNMGWGEIAKIYGVKVKDLKKGNYEVVNAARERGVDVTYIEVDDNNNYVDQRNVNDHDGSPSDKGNRKKDNNGKANGHKK